MTCPSSDIDLTQDDMHLIETALCETQRLLAHRHLSYEHCSCLEGAPSGEKAQILGETLSRIEDLLRRMGDHGDLEGAAAF
ncbi:hypothetical protein RSK20926_16972 [Roseobacter sp. SK209-2-6]|uniref:hypothetical protein n=1 Tax=Roseobacter sp. SK209-2-6 TaxID=388739 RepID=UPI0000F3BFCE|nr:hypothetical protein [Roseobacter sp. SK209-2-6]EBA14909.1 hypothetical protein RSK20926_16972 [Roseobacter sp. SK209-2-6]